jgi:hypothetical protein
MLDELLEVFERDRKPGEQPRKRGIRGLFARLLSGGDDRNDDRRHGDSDDDDDERTRDPAQAGRSTRHRPDRDGEGFDFD